ncbi:MAG: hypothetical protein HY904_11905 [Deltaproteobacteria bacterium]|nr:hypothetical protein [Deltaproteobacteria bacterium]
MLPLEGYLASLNEQLADHLRSPVRNASNAELARDFWTSAEMNQLPYQRGALLALWVDSEVRRASAGQRNLDHLMRALVARGRTGERVNTDMLLTLIQSETSAGFARELRRMVVEGFPFELPVGVLAPCMEGRAKPGGQGAASFEIARRETCAGVL